MECYIGYSSKNGLKKKGCSPDTPLFVSALPSNLDMECLTPTSPQTPKRAENWAENWGNGVWGTYIEENFPDKPATGNQRLKKLKTYPLPQNYPRPTESKSPPPHSSNGPPPPPQKTHNLRN